MKNFIAALKEYFGITNEESVSSNLPVEPLTLEHYLAESEVVHLPKHGVYLPYFRNELLMHHCDYVQDASVSEAKFDKGIPYFDLDERTGTPSSFTTYNGAIKALVLFIEREFDIGVDTLPAVVEGEPVTDLPVVRDRMSVPDWDCLDPNGKPTDMTWQNTLFPHATLGHITEMVKYTRVLSYTYFAWNDRIYKHDGEDTGFTVNDLA